MDEIKIGKAFEEEFAREEEQELGKVVSVEAGSGKDTKTILVVVITLVAVLGLSLGGFSVYNDLTSATVLTLEEMHALNKEGELRNLEGYLYNGFSFVKYDGLWHTELFRFGSKVLVPLHFGAKEVEHIQISGTLLPEFNDGAEVFIAIDPKVQNKFYTLGLSELSMNLAKGIRRAPIGVCTKEHEACVDRVIINCENANGRPTVELALAEETSVVYEGTCIKISGNDYDFVRAVDRVLLKWYGIMP